MGTSTWSGLVLSQQLVVLSAECSSDEGKGGREQGAGQRRTRRWVSFRIHIGEACLFHLLVEWMNKVLLHQVHTNIKTTLDLQWTSKSIKTALNLNFEHRKLLSFQKQKKTSLTCTWVETPGVWISFFVSGSPFTPYLEFLLNFKCLSNSAPKKTSGDTFLRFKKEK